MTIRINGLCFRIPLGKDEHHCRIELYLSKKGARDFMPHLEREVSSDDTVELIENVTLEVGSTRMDIFLLEEEEPAVPNAPLHLSSFSQVRFIGDERRFHRARAAFAIEHGCQPQDLL